MSIVRKKATALRRGRADKARIRRATPSQIRTWREEEGYGDYEISSRARAVPKVDARKIRERIGLTQEEFAIRYRLPLRTVQEWEQGRKQPSEPARVLLFAISRDPKALENALQNR